MTQTAQVVRQIQPGLVEIAVRRDSACAGDCGCVCATGVCSFMASVLSAGVLDAFSGATVLASA